jgi:RNA polymerase sigma factor (sigma-70 family)
MSYMSTYDQLYREFSPKISSYFRCRMNNAWDVEDLTTTVFLKAFTKLDQYNGTYPFGSWLYAIARNTMIDYLRKQRELPTESEWISASMGEDESFPEAQLMRKEEFRVMWRHVKSLTSDQYRVIALRYLEEKSMKEIATEMGKTEAAVKIIHFRAIKILRQRMKRHA